MEILGRRERKEEEREEKKKIKRKRGKQKRKRRESNSRVHKPDKASLPSSSLTASAVTERTGAGKATSILVLTKKVRELEQGPSELVCGVLRMMMMQMGRSELNWSSVLLSSARCVLQCDDTG